MLAAAAASSAATPAGAAATRGRASAAWPLLAARRCWRRDAARAPAAPFPSSSSSARPLCRPAASSSSSSTSTQAGEARAYLFDEKDDSDDSDDEGAWEDAFADDGEGDGAEAGADAAPGPSASKSDAFAELVRLAVAKDPSLLPLAEKDLGRARLGGAAAGSTAAAGAPGVLQSPFAPGGGADAGASNGNANASGPRPPPPLASSSASLMLGPSLAALPAGRKPPWLRQRAPQGEKYTKIFGQMRALGLATVCEEAQCPNIGECWDGDLATATIMLMGDTCTRGCRFCAVNTAARPLPLDPNEPLSTATAVASWGVGYVVLTSVDRDDLADGGAAHFAETVRAMKRLRPSLLVECLAPDFGGDARAIGALARSGLDVFAHNVETVERLQRRVRDPRAGYFQTLAVLREAKRAAAEAAETAAEEAAAGSAASGGGAPPPPRPPLVTKTSIMLGLGETDDEIVDAMLDCRDAGVDIFTLGQYLQPTSRHLPVERFVPPEEFERWAAFGRDEVGFRYVAAGPMVRSSYKAGELFVEGMLRKDREKASQGAAAGGALAATARK